MASHARSRFLLVNNKNNDNNMRVHTQKRLTLRSNGKRAH